MQKQNGQVEDQLSSDAVVSFGPYEVDCHNGKLWKHGLRIKLSGQPLEILLLLLERPGELVTREELRKRLWVGNVFVDFERSLNSAVKKLRRTLNDDPQEPRYIETEPRKGYRFIGTLHRASTGNPEPLQAGFAIADPPGDPQPHLARNLVGNDPALPAKAKRTRHRRLLVLDIGVAVLLAVSGFIVYRTTRKASLSHIITVSKNTNFRSSIAVLGLKNLSSGREADWLSTAITQMLSTELANGYKVRIIPEETVSREKLELGLKDKDGYSRETLRALRNDLGGDYVVAGSYLALGDRNAGQVRMDLRLQETISGETLASIAVSGKQSIDLVSRAGLQMRMKLGATVPPEGDVDWRTVLPHSPEAARLYSDGLKQLRLLDNVAASQLLEKSVSVEPDFALGHAAMAEAWSALGYEARALTAAQKAVALSNSLPEDERLEIEGRYYELKHDWAGAIGAYWHLWQDFPDDLESGLKLAAAQAASGNVNDAFATLSTLRSHAPSQQDDPRIDLAEASIAARNGDYRREQVLAEEAVRKAQASGSRPLMAHAQLVRGEALKHQSAIEEAAQAYRIAQQIFQTTGDREGNATALIGIGLMLQKQGDLPGALEKIKQARDYFQQLGDNAGLNTALTSLSNISRAQEKFVEKKVSTVNR